jgi:phage terminase small subunit
MEKLRPKQKLFVKNYIDNGGNGTQAIIDAKYDVKDRIVAKSMASENLTKPDIRLALDNHAEKAESQIYKLSQTANGEMVRLQASKDILDRAGYGATIKTQQTNVNVEITPEMFEIAKKYENELDKIEDENNIRPNLNSELDKEGGN